MADQLSRRDVLAALAVVTASTATTLVMPSAQRAWKSWRAETRADAAASFFQGLDMNSLSLVQVVVTGPHARFIQLSPAEWNRLFGLLRALLPCPQVTTRPVGYGSLQLLLFPAALQSPEPVRLSWFPEPSVAPSHLLHVGKPFDALLADGALFPWLQSFT